MLSEPRASSPSWTLPSILVPSVVNSLSVLVGQRAADVDGGEQGEHIGLQELDETLEEGHDDREDHGYAAGREADHALRLEQQVLTAQDAQQQDEVSGEHVERETEGERDRAEDHRRHE